MRHAMKKYKLFAVPLFLLLLNSCNESPPVVQEGYAVLKIVAIGDTSMGSQIPQYAPLKNAKVILSSEYGLMVKYTDENGILTMSGIPSSTYSISIRKSHPSIPNVLLVGNLTDQVVTSGNVVVDTIKAAQIANTGIAINEIYSCGPVNSVFFFYDIFFELYNYSDEVKYLDGMMIMRVSGNSAGKGAGADEGDDGDIDGVTYAYKFPGNPGEKNYPFLPGTFKVLAVTAVDHRKTVSSSIDLSHADWEFYNQYSTADFDNPKVPNLINLRSDNRTEFLVGLNSDVIMLSSGVDSNWEDGINISTVIDAVEYRGSATIRKTADPRIDKGFVVAPSKYSGKSMQRRELGVDTNNSTLDFEIIPVPTPGRQ